MSEDRPIYAVPTHLQQREPMAFGLTVGELAKLLVAGFASARLMFSTELPSALRLPGAAVVFGLGAAWAVLRIRGHSLDAWLGMAFRYGARPKRRVWRPSSAAATALEDAGEFENQRGGWFEVDHIRLRWTTAPEAVLTVAADAELVELSPAI